MEYKCRAAGCEEFAAYMKESVLGMLLLRAMHQGKRMCRGWCTPTAWVHVPWMTRGRSQMKLGQQTAMGEGGMKEGMRWCGGYGDGDGNGNRLRIRQKGGDDIGGRMGRMKAAWGAQ